MKKVSIIFSILLLISIQKIWAQTPYLGTPYLIPGLIEAENYDKGGQNVAYYDIDTCLFTDNYGRNDSVDTRIASDSHGGYNISDTQPLEWLLYTVEIGSAGRYEFQLRYAGQKDSKLHFSLDGTAITDTLLIPTTGWWHTWKTISIAETVLPEGKHKLKLHFDDDSIKVNYFIVNLIEKFEPVFSPNGDGVSDRFFIEDIGHVKIFSPEGALIKELDTPAYWDGTDKNDKTLSTGYYMIIVNDSKKIPVTIIR